MRVVSDATQAAWESAYKGGDQAAVARVTIQRVFSHDTTYDQSALPGTHRQGSGVFRSAIFGQADQPVELPNVAKITINRGVDQDAATCTLELWNTRPLSMGEVPTDTDLKQLDLPGWFTAGRGATSEAIEQWQQTPNGWRDYIQPDRIIKTYQGYGVDLDQPPETDPNLYITGTWMIDDVEYTADGMIRVTCRDLGRLLMDQLCLPPTVPWAEYPLRWETFHNVDNPDIISTSLATSWFTPTYRTDSNVPYIGKGFTDGSMPYVRSDGSVLGHKGAHAFDASLSTYWLSVGNYANWSSAFEYVEGQFSARSISAVEVAAWGGPYTVYISVMVGGVWQGSSKIPYHARAVDTNADIRFVKAVRVAKNGTLQIVLPKAYANATRVRITFANLYDSGIGRYQYRAGCRRLRVLGTSSITKSTDGGTHVEGNYGDYTDIVKLLCAWGGLYWPQEDAYIHQSDGTLYSYPPGSDDMILSTGRAWGDFELTGTAGIADLDESMWDKTPLMDGISQIRDIVGFNFFLDETGGAIWRMPNIWSIGNYVSSLDGGIHLPARSTDLLEIRDDRTLLSYSAKLSSRNVRDHVIVATTSGRYGAVSAGYNPSPTGFDRVGGWTDQRFASEAECQIMADLITLRQSFEYRTSPITIPGHPGVQIDDQVKMYERVTSDTFVHYVRGLSHTWERLSGRWTMDLDVHWLGESPGSRWAFDPAALTVATQRYLATLGYVTTIVGEITSPGDPGTTPSTPPGELPPPEGPYTTVLFEDTFSGSSVDTSKWNVRSDSQSNHNGRNSPAACTVSGGQLHIRSGLSGDSAKPWTSGYLDTIGKSSFRYGRWEIRCRFPWGPTGAGYWPAFWLRPDDGGIGEIDIMEAWANRKSAHNSLWRDYTGTPHKEGQQFAKVVPGYVGTDWHTYAVEKDPGVLRFYIDDILVWTATSSNVPWFTEAFDRAVDWNIRLQLQIGGSYEGTPTSSTILTQTYDVDYVRVTGA